MDLDAPPFDAKFACVSAAGDGDLPRLRRAHARAVEEEEEWDDLVCVAAAAFGHLECLRYAHDHGCPWQADLMCWIACGHLECLRYVHEHGCPLDAYTFHMALRRGNDNACLRYLHEHGCPYAAELRPTVVRRVLLPKWREAVRARAIGVYWMGYAAESACAPGGAGRKRDLAEYEASFFS